ncbi:toxin glutamine deamidase domain-containing protein [Kitasatospora sp. NE20-6]|uniref:toxin glutamine deamidase domain-containing protein n=1 Tax=Kitasatospora sp. NE20-6 TaxID=2859066 RepID=UPI0038B2FB58
MPSGSVPHVPASDGSRSSSPDGPHRAGSVQTASTGVAEAPPVHSAPTPAPDATTGPAGQQNTPPATTGPVPAGGVPTSAAPGGSPTATRPGGGPVPSSAPSDRPSTDRPTVPGQGPHRDAPDRPGFGDRPARGTDRPDPRTSDPRTSDPRTSDTCPSTDRPGTDRPAATPNPEAGPRPDRPTTDDRPATDDRPTTDDARADEHAGPAADDRPADDRPADDRPADDSRPAADDTPAHERPLSESRPHDTPGGLAPVDPRHQQELESRIPKNPDGTPQRHPDPAGDWPGAVNGDGHRTPGRDNNCLDVALSSADTYSGNPTAAAPRTDDGTGDGEHGGRDRAERQLGAPFRDLGNGDQAFHRLEDQLRQSGHGSQAVIVTQDAHGRAHAWNVVNHNGKITYLDNQTGARSDKPLHNGDHGVWAIPLDSDRRPLTPDGDGTPHRDGADGADRTADTPGGSDRRPEDPAGKRTADDADAEADDAGEPQAGPSEERPPKRQKPNDDAMDISSSDGTNDGTNDATQTEPPATQHDDASDASSDLTELSDTESELTELDDSDDDGDGGDPDDKLGSTPYDQAQDSDHTHRNMLGDGEQQGLRDRPNATVKQSDLDVAHDFLRDRADDKSLGDFLQDTADRVKENRTGDEPFQVGFDKNELEQRLPGFADLNRDEQGAVLASLGRLSLAVHSDYAVGASPEHLPDAYAAPHADSQDTDSQDGDGQDGDADGQDGDGGHDSDTDMPDADGGSQSGDGHDGDGHDGDSEDSGTTEEHTEGSRGVNLHERHDFWGGDRGNAHKDPSELKEGEKIREPDPARLVREHLTARYQDEHNGMAEKQAERLLRKETKAFVDGEHRPDFSGKNYAVIETVDSDGNVRYVVDSSIPVNGFGWQSEHSEPHLGNWIDRVNANADTDNYTISHLWTEREPCGGGQGHGHCSAYLTSSMPDTDVGYGVGYRKGQMAEGFNTPEDRAAAAEGMKQDMQDHLNDLGDLWYDLATSGELSPGRARNQYQAAAE